MSGDASANLIRALVEHLRWAPDGWESLSFVIEIAEGMRSISGMAYGPGGTVTPVTSHPLQVDPALDDYLAGYFQPGEALPVALLVQFDRSKGQYEITFEDTDVSRWKATPANLETIGEELRPRF